MYGPRMHKPRMPRQRMYRTRTRTRTFSSGPATCGDVAMGSPMGDCGCSSPAMIAPQTMMRPQQITTYVDVPKTVMRQEAVQVQVPTTTYRQVAVDEGGYQQVWVPKMVTKNVAQTVMQTQVQYRQFPQTVMERVPQITTHMVPEQIARQYSPTIIGSPVGQSFAVGSQSFPIATPTSVTPIYETSPAPLNPVPTPMNETATLPHPAPQTSQVQDWQKVRQRPSTIQQQAYEVESVETGYRVPKAIGRFSSKK